MLVPAIENVYAFGCLVVASLRLSATRVTAERDFVRFDELAMIQQSQRAFVLYDDDAIRKQR